MVGHLPRLPGPQGHPRKEAATLAETVFCSRPLLLVVWCVAVSSTMPRKAARGRQLGSCNGPWSVKAHAAGRQAFSRRHIAPHCMCISLHVHVMLPLPPSPESGRASSAVGLSYSFTIPSCSTADRAYGSGKEGGLSTSAQSDQLNQQQCVRTATTRRIPLQPCCAANCSRGAGHKQYPSQQPSPRMRSLPMMVCSRCAMVSTVQSANAEEMVACSKGGRSAQEEGHIDRRDPPRG